MSAIGVGFEDIAQAYVALRPYNDETKPWNVELVTTNMPSAEDLTARLFLACTLNKIALKQNFKPNWKIEKIPEKDWLAESYEQFPPFETAGFFIHGSHYEEDIPKGLIKLQIDAATAFGSGEHATTKGCLQAMTALKEQGACPWNVLDMGTGSGILAIAAWKLWKTPILAVDIEEESVRVATRHRSINNVPDVKTGLSCVCGNGFETSEVQTKKPFDLIIANILAGPLIEMAESCAAVSDENGYIILSGLLNEQADKVIAAYRDQGMPLKDRINIGEWSTLVLQNAAA